MKTWMITLFLALVLVQGNLRAQDTLTLSVEQLVHGKVALYNLRNASLRDEDTLKMSSSSCSD